MSETDGGLPEEFDDYVIGRELDRGAMGRVYVATDAMLDRPVAIKLISNREPDIAARHRFLFEARAAARIHHPNVVTIYRVGELGDRPYIVSELVRGSSLAKLAKPMAAEAVLEIAIGLARGLAAAHREHVVHCDLKPANVMIGDDGAPKIIDFGLARLVSDASAPAGASVGTPDYMAPEVWGGSMPGRRSDVYSLGAVLYELLAGEPPFASVEVARLREAVTTGDAPPIRERVPALDPGLAEVVTRCLRRDPEARFAGGEDLREALEGLHSSRRAAQIGGNPYRGLRAFEAEHRGVFFGRTSEINALVERLRAEPVVIVTGDSGVGKSSLCRAGVLPAVTDSGLGGSATWTELAIVPGPHPLRAIAAALGDPTAAARILEAPEVLPRELRRFAGDRGLIVFVDQLEELITLGDPDEVAAVDAALARLGEGSPGLRLIATVRADFLSRLAALPRLGRDLSRLLYFLRPLPPERLRDVIVSPAIATNVAFESDEIVDELIAATAQAGSGGLPLLSFALADLWEARDHDVITRAAVDAMGGVTGALSRHADNVIDGMTPTDRGVARRILARLVTAMGTRAQRTEAELAIDGAARTVIDLLVKGRLVVVHDGEAGPVYELAHEVLLSGWGMLRGWLATDVEGRARRERLTAATTEWLRLERRSDATWQGTRLEEARSLDLATVSGEERAFVKASSRAVRRRRWLRWAAVGTAVVLVGLAFAIPRYLTRRALDAEIATELAIARTEIDAARAAVRQQTAHASDAYAAFDANRRADGERLWKRALDERVMAEHHYRDAGRHVETALAKDSTLEARDLLGDILVERAELAELAREPERRSEQLERLPLYDEGGSRQDKLAHPGRLVVRAPAGAAITLEPDRRRLGTTEAETALPPGSYVVVVEAAGRVATRAPILVERDRPIELVLDPPARAAVPAGFVYVPRGEFLFGYANEDSRVVFFRTAPLHRRTTGAFLIGRTEVTVADWLAYVDALPAAERPGRLPGVPGKLSGTLAFELEDAGRWQITFKPEEQSYTAAWGQPIQYAGRTRNATQDWRRFPVTGISAHHAEAYAAWLDRTGRLPGARMCSEVEWERAARGADGRDYPGDKAFDPADLNLDQTYGPGLMGPDEVGLHPGSSSPFGLVDMAGNAFEWTVSEEGDYVLRGGGFGHDRMSAHPANRSAAGASLRDAAVGLRLCVTLPPAR